MKTQIISITIILSLITLVSAITMYPGGCYYIEFPNSAPVNWSVEGNSSNMNGFSYNKTGTNITYCFDEFYKPDNFTITFYNYQSVEIDDSPSGGGSSCIYNKDFDWNCSEWGECNGEQTRICKKYNNCHNTYGKPDEIRNCSVQHDTDKEEEKEIDEPEKSHKWIIIGIGTLAILLIIILTTIYLKIKTKKQKTKRFKN